ncbi:golgin-45 isoform X2 [Aricia agestis]|nr:golgin-45 isoform X2 [Aricia agestis]XP_041968628.1 golgin-45 isoform X2 [Aricia agestis]
MFTKARTAGDGMESNECVTESSERYKQVIKKDQKREVSLTGRLVQVFPTKFISSERTSSQIYSKTPKFVPYEPYPGAVKPIMGKTRPRNKKSRNNMDINKLISQMSQMNTDMTEYKPRSKSNKENKENLYDGKKSDSENQMQIRLDELHKENESLKEQLKQQVQVNKELKTMLVASMGEDLEVQVQSLNEDKKHLADALLNSSQHLSTHQEQTEWLAGQCEVWRSKFLASSLMIEELASCKKILNEKTLKLEQAIKQLLDERCRVREMTTCTYKNLYRLHDNWLESIAIAEYMGANKVSPRPIGNLNFNTSIPHSANILDIASVNLKLSENISSSVEKQDVGHLDGLVTTTEAEKFAEEAMAMPVDVKKVNEDPVNALVHHAYNNSSNVTPPVASCAHCNGKVQLL